MKTIIITGASSGIGKEAAHNLAKTGHRILILCREGAKSEQIHTEILTQSGNNEVYLIRVDLSDPESIRAAVEDIKDKYPSIDVLVNNAGIFKVKRTETADQIEMDFAVNFLAPFVLSESLLENLKASGNGRIINLVSELYKRGSIDLKNLMLKDLYRPSSAYCTAELAKAMYTVELAKRTLNRNITVNGLHPGTIATGLYRESPGFMTKMMNIFSEKPLKGGERVAYLALSDDVEGVTGKFFSKSKQQEFTIALHDAEKGEKLWRKASQLSGTPLG